MRVGRAAALCVTAALMLAAAACGSAPGASTSGGHTKSGAAGGASKASSPAANSSAKSPVRIAWVGPLTGFLAQNALDAKHGTEMAIAKINAAGGIGGRKVVVDYVDVGVNPAKARQAVQREILANHAVGIVGGFYTPNCLAYLPVIDKYHVPSIAYDCSAYKVTHSGSHYMFRTDEGNQAADGTMAIYAVKTMHDKRFVMFGGADAYAEGNMTQFSAKAKQLGGTIVGKETYNPATTKDFTSLISKYRGKKVDAFYLAGSSPQMALIMRQSRANGFKEDFVGGLGTDRKIIWTGAGKASVGTVLAVDDPAMAVNGSQYMTAKQKAWFKAFTAKYHKPQGSFDAGHSYDATMLLVKAIEKAGSTSGPAVRKAILQVGHDYHGVLDDFSLTQNGDAHQKMYIMQWQKDGKMHIIKVLSASTVYG